MFTKLKTASLERKLILLNLASLFFIFSLVHFYVFPKLEDMFIDSHKTKIKNTVEVMDNLLAGFEARVKSGELTKEAAQTQAAEIVKALRYNEQEYFWIHNTDLKMIMHPTNAKLVGTDISQVKDPNGVHVFAEMNKLAEKTGDAFLQYMWPKPGSDKPVEKYSYVKTFKPWGWIVGNGIYFDQIRATVSALRWALYGGLGLAAILSCIGTAIFSQRLAKTLREALKSLQDSGTQMSSLSSALAQTGNNVSAGVAESAASITETSASMEEIGLMSQKNTDCSVQTQTTADQCLSATREGQKVMGQMMVCMGEISQSNKNVLEQNQQSAQRIAEIIQVIKHIEHNTKAINDIVFQTKILSFNASVEAARAGEAGKGFSIVAEEVGKLAEMSGLAAKAIETSLQDGIQKVERIVKEDISQSQHTISSAGQKVAEGTVVVKSCEAIFEQILRKATEVVELSNQISGGCKEQRIGLDQINKAILQLDEASQTNAQASVEVATSVEKIADQAQQVHTYSHAIYCLIEGDVKKVA